MPAKLTTEQFIKKAIAVHGTTYDYSCVDYIHGKVPVTIICKKHGKFEQKPYNHITMKHGCPQCGKELAAELKTKSRKNIEQFIADSRSVHGDTYEYDMVCYVNATTPVQITCREHGQFFQTPNDHISRKAGCPICGHISSGTKRRQDQSQFIATATQVHAGVYDYSAVEYVTSQRPVTITCKIHGPFIQLPNNHVFSKAGCPRCADIKRASITTSDGEQQLCEFLTNLGVEFKQHDRTIIPPYELDIVIPSKQLAIEYCGLYWHSEQNGRLKNYHKTKYDLCKSNGFRLLTIFEDEWVHKRTLVETKLKMILGHTDLTRVYARSCNVVIASTNEKQQFFNENHIQGDGPSSINLALKHKDTIVAMMGFIAHANGQFYLNRYATSMHVVGGFSKLLRAFQVTHDWKKLISFADLRWSVGDVYVNTGWVLESALPPDYAYVQGNKRHHKFNFRHKHLGRRLSNYDGTKTEKQNCISHGLLRIWDCGKLKFVLHNKY